MQELKDWTQLAAWAVAIIGGYFAAKKTMAEMRSSTKLREEDLRWKQANAAKELIADIHHHPLASDAVRMMDWDEGTTEHQIAPGKTAKIAYDAVLSALQKKQSECQSETDVHVRDCFDWFFYYMDRIQHYIDSRLITFADVRSVFRPYAKKIGSQKKIYQAFIQSHEYDLALKFLGQYEEYAHAQANVMAPGASSEESNPASRSAGAN